MNTQQLKELRNALSCWQDDYDCDDDKEQYDMFGAAIDAVSRLEAAERERDDLKENQTRALQLVARRERQVLRYQKEIARRDALALGSQQQKVVELPEPVKWPEIPFKYFSEEQVFSMLDAAGVKWEVKK